MPKNITELTAEQLEEFFYVSHAIIARSVTFFNCEASMSGMQNERRVRIIKETGHPDLKYITGNTGIYIEQNYEVLMKIYGKNDADAYKDFCGKLEEIYKQEVKSIIPSLEVENRETYDQFISINLYDLIIKNNLRSHKGCEVYFRIVAYSARPDELSKKVKLLCQMLIAKIQAKEDPVHIAAKIFEFTHEHVFPNGNGGHARFIANCLLLLLCLRAINLNNHKAKLYAAIENPTQSVTAIERLIIDSLHATQDKPLEEYAIVEQDIFHAYMPTSMPFVVVEFDDHLDLVKAENYQTYVNLISSVPSQPSAKQVSILQELASTIFLRLDEESLIHLAVKVKNRFPQMPMLKMYCVRRACDFYLKKGDYTNAEACYIDLLNYCEEEKYFSAAYNYAVLAHNLCKEEDKSKYRPCLDHLNFVAKRRNALDMKYSPIELEALYCKHHIRLGGAQLVKTNASVVPDIRAAINADNEQKLSLLRTEVINQLRRITHQEWMINLQQRRAGFITTDGELVKQIVSYFKQHNIEVREGRPGASQASDAYANSQKRMVQITTFDVKKLSQIPSMQIPSAAQRVTAKP